MTATMRASCLVTIQPNITPDGVARLADAVVNRLWPGNAGGVLLIYHRDALRMFSRLAAEAMVRKQAVEIRARRDGLKITIEPASARDRS